MNHFAALVGAPGNEREREDRLRQAIGNTSGQISFTHPEPGVSLGWSGDAGLTALALKQGQFALVHGSAHKIPDKNQAPVTVDDPGGLADWLLERSIYSLPVLEGLDGSFVAAVGGLQSGLTLSGDPSGNRLPYFATQHQELIFSNHPLVCARMLADRQLDRSIEDFSLIYGFTPDNHTSYKGVHRLLKGSLLQYKDSKWQIIPSPVPAPATTQQEIPTSDDALFDRLYEVLLSCTEDQLSSTDEIGVLLGGFDSALIAALLHRLGKRVHTYSFRYADTQYNQPHTDTLSRFLGCKHTWVDITPDVIADGLDNYAEQYVQPTNWLNYVIQSVHVCRRMRQDGISYAFSGDGCDSVLLGYPGTYKRTRAFARLPQLPAPLVSLLTKILGWPALDRKIGHPYRVAMNMLRAMARPMPARAFLTFRVMDEITLKSIRKQAHPPPQNESLDAIANRLAAPYQHLSIQRLGYAAKSMISPNRAKLIACADVAGVRVHSPYLHPALLDFATQIPDHLLRKQSHSDIRDPGKICLSKMAERHKLLPEEIIHQPKLAAIDSPIDTWFASTLRPQLNHALAGLPFRTDSRHLDALIKTTRAERFYKQHIGSTAVISDAISLLATYGSICGALEKAGTKQ